jgi:DNA polymerase III delta subunit
LSKIISEINKLLITIDYIEPKNITENIAAELEESIFQIIDDILNKNIVSAIKKIDITLHDINVYAFYNNLLANLRTTTYILQYKHFDIEPRNIGIKLNL